MDENVNNISSSFFLKFFQRYSYRCCPIHPDDHTLLIGRHFSVDVDTLLYEDEHGDRRHEGEHRVQDDAKDVQLWREGREMTTNEPFSDLTHRSFSRN